MHENECGNLLLSPRKAVNGQCLSETEYLRKRGGGAHVFQHVPHLLSYEMRRCLFPCPCGVTVLALLSLRQGGTRVGALLAGRAASRTLPSSPSSVSSGLCLACGRDPGRGAAGHRAPGSPGPGEAGLLLFPDGLPCALRCPGCPRPSRSMCSLSLQQQLWVEMESFRSVVTLEHRQGQFSFP